MTDVDQPDQPEEQDQLETDDVPEDDEQDDGPPTGEQGAEGDADGRPRNSGRDKPRFMDRLEVKASA